MLISCCSKTIKEINLESNLILSIVKRSPFCRLARFFSFCQCHCYCYSHFWMNIVKSIVFPVDFFLSSSHSFAWLCCWEITKTCSQAYARSLKKEKQKKKELLISIQSDDFPFWVTIIILRRLLRFKICLAEHVATLFTI